jgi:hypothetical protein
MNTREFLVHLEHVLVTKLRPTFLAVAEVSTDGTVEVIMSCLQFRGRSIQERTGMVFNILKYYLAESMTERLVVVQCFDSTEIDEILSAEFNQSTKASD